MATLPLALVVMLAGPAFSAPAPAPASLAKYRPNDHHVPAGPAAGHRGRAGGGAGAASHHDILRVAHPIGEALGLGIGPHQQRIGRGTRAEVDIRGGDSEAKIARAHG